MDNLSDAIRDALAEYLRGELVQTFPTVEVSGEWPEPGVALPAMAVTVLAVGNPDTEYHPASVYNVTQLVSPKGAVQYSYGWIEQSMQLDVWATFKATRNALAASIPDLLNRHPLDTLELDSLPHYTRHAGVVLRVPGLLGAPCDYRFDGGPVIEDASDSAQSSEWRATWTGVARMQLVGEQILSLVKQITLKATIDGIVLPDRILAP
jgi:hypothetical protein